MNKLYCFIFLVFFSGTVFGKDPFDGISCKNVSLEQFKGTNISSLKPKIQEKAHRDLALKLIAESDRNEGFFFQSWSVCAKKIIIVASPKARIITDAVIIP